jgi:hypothetical protein
MFFLARNQALKVGDIAPVRYRFLGFFIGQDLGSALDMKE